MRKLLTPTQFRSLAMRGAPEAKSARVSAFFPAEVKVGDAAKREMTFTISTDIVDRMGDTIDVKGWDLEAFKKNPVVLWAHDNESLPVGKATRVWIDGEKLKATAEFTPEGMARFNDTVFDMLKGGFLNAVSVGFMPKDWKFVEDADRRFGIDFLKQELLEFSVVSVPANPEALVEPGEKSAPMIDADLTGDAEKAGPEVILPPMGMAGAQEWVERLAKWRGAGQKLVFANGVFRVVPDDEAVAIRRAARARQLELLAFAAR